MKKAVVILIILSIVGMLGWQIYKKGTGSLKDSARRHRTAAVAVEIAQVQKTRMRDVRLFTGSLLPRSEFVVAPKIAGRLEKLFVGIGDRIRRDQLVAILDDDEYIQKVEQVQAELKVARANLEESRSALKIAERVFERVRTLRRKKIISRSELDSAEAEYNAEIARHKAALAQVTQREAVLKAAQVRLSYTKIRTSWEDGDEYRVVGERFVDEGAMLSANTPIVSVLDIGSTIAVIHVIEKDYFKIRIGQETTVSTDAFSGRTFSGRVDRIAPMLKEASREARVEIEVPNLEGLLKPGMFVRVQIEFASHDNATVVPVTALVKRDGRQGVFVADLDVMEAHFVPVTLGILNGEMAEVVEPLLSGWVVTLGHHLLEDGTAIMLPEKRSEDEKMGKGFRRK